MKRTLAALMFLLVFCCVSAADPYRLPAPLEESWQKGFQLLFNMEYALAEAEFQKMIQAEPKHPAGYIYHANAIWLNHLARLRRLHSSLYNRSDSFFYKGEEEPDRLTEKKFREQLNKGISLSEARLRRNRNDPEAIYFLGVAKNIAAGFETTVKRSFFHALRQAEPGVDLHRKLLKKDPEFTDAKLSIGIYNYVAGSLPLAVKILAFLGGVHGSKGKGIAMLEEVSREGHYAKDEAAVMLVMLYNREKRTADSLPLLERLSRGYPGNYLFQLELASTLANAQKFPESFRAFDRLLENDRAMSEMPDLIHYKYAEALFEARLWENSRAQYEKAASFPTAPASLVTMTYLFAGQCLDALGRRDEAIRHYKLVLKRKEALDSHELARKYLKSPFVP